MRQRSGTPNNDWQRRHDPASLNTSPARSTFSLTSTINLCQTARSPSATTIPGKIPSPSPLYYDYTEEFDIDDYKQTEILEAQPQSRVQKTISEDRPLCSAWTCLDDPDMPDQKANFNSVLQNSTPTTCVFQKSLAFAPGSMTSRQSVSILDPPAEHSSDQVALPAKGSYETASGNVRDRKTFRLSGLGVVARELSTHVEEVFGLPSTTSFEILVSDTTANAAICKDGHRGQGDHAEVGRNTSYSSDTHLNCFAPTRKSSEGQFSETREYPALSLTFSTSPEVHNTLDSCCSGKDSAIPKPEDGVVTNVIGPFPASSSSLQSDRNRLSRLCSKDTTLTNVDQIVDALKEASRTKAAKQQIPESKVLPRIPPYSRNGPLYGDELSLQHFNHPSTSGQSHIENGDDGQPNQNLTGSHPQERGQLLEAVSVSTVFESGIPNFSHQFSRDVTSHSELPLLAPKPISPAKQFQLRNSVPQIMKALPPLPLDIPTCVDCPLLPSNLSGDKLPHRFSPLLIEFKRDSTQEVPRCSEPQLIGDCDPVSHRHGAPESIELDAVTVTTQMLEQKYDDRMVHTPPPPPKLKLKMRYFSAFRKTSDPEHQPWNSEHSYASYGQPFSSGQPSVIQKDKPATPKLRKLKLKLTQVCHSTMGTVRVNRESGDASPSVALHLRHRKDLFTPNSGIEKFFRQVSQHMYSRKTSASSSHHLVEQRHLPTVAPLSDQTSLTRSVSAHLSSQPSLASLNEANPPEVCSAFSNNSSDLKATARRLGRRTSVFKAPITTLYASSYGTRYHDEGNWRSRDGPAALLNDTSRSRPNLHEAIPGNKAKRPRRLSERLYAQKLRARFSAWFEGARTAIRGRVKPRSFPKDMMTTTSSCNR